MTEESRGYYVSFWWAPHFWRERNGLDICSDECELAATGVCLATGVSVAVTEALAAAAKEAADS